MTTTFPPSLPLSLPVYPQAIHGTLSQAVLEDAKAFMQEELVRKAAQTIADAAMDAEQQRYIHVREKYHNFLGSTVPRCPAPRPICHSSLGCEQPPDLYVTAP